MITEQTKAKAKARLKQCISVEEVAEELNLPVKLVEEWATKLNGADLVAQEATLLAVEKLQAKADAGVIEPLNTELLRKTIEDTALDLTKAMAIPAINGDMVHAKAIQLMADALVKMYQIIVMKGGVIDGGGDAPSNKSLELFGDMMRD